MQQLQQEFGLHLDDFCITLSDHEFPARYLVNIELAHEQQLDSPNALLQRFEHWMQEFNNPYGTVRQGQVPPPRLRILAPGSFAKLRQRQVERGMFDSQLKIPHISEDRTFLADLPVMYEVGLENGAIDRSSVLTAVANISLDKARGEDDCSRHGRLLNGRSPRGADFIQANLSQMDLRGMDLSHADLSGADLSAQISATLI